LPGIVDAGGNIQIQAERWIDESIEIGHSAIAEENGVLITISVNRKPHRLAEVVDAEGFAYRTPRQGAKSFSTYGQPDHLIALQQVNRKNVVEVFNGPGPVALECGGRKQKNGQCQMSIARLKKAMEKVADADHIRPINQLLLCQQS
jgi:hypothetical protein